MKSRSVLAFLIAFCMLFSMLPVFSFAAATVKYLDADYSSGDPVWSFSDIRTENSVGIIVDGAEGDTYILTQDITELALIINNVNVVLTQEPTFSMFMIAGNGSVTSGSIKISIAIPTEPCTAADVDGFVTFFMAERFQSQDYSYTIIDDCEIFDDMNPYDFTVEEGVNLTISTIFNVRHNCYCYGDIYISSPGDNQNPNGLNIEENGSFVLGEKGSLTAAPGQIFEIRNNATSQGLTVWDGEFSVDTIDFEHETMTFSYENGKWLFTEKQVPMGFTVFCPNDTVSVQYNLGNGSVDCVFEDFIEYGDASSVTLTFNGDFYGLAINYDDEPTQYLKYSDLTDGTYTITDLSKSCYIDVIEHEMPFNNEYAFYFDGLNNAAISTELQGDVWSGRILSYTVGTPISANITLPYNVSSIYKIEAEYNNSENIVDITSSYSNGNFSYTPTQSEGLRINIYWTEEQYLFEKFEIAEGNKEIQVFWSGEGSASIDSDHTATYGNSSLAEIASGVTSVNISLSPSDGYKFSSIWINENNYSVQDVIDLRCPGVTINESANILTFTVSGNDIYHYINIEFEEDNSGKCLVIYDTLDITAQYALGNGEFQNANDWEWIDYSEEGSITVKFQANENRAFYGIRVKNRSTDTESYIKADSLTDNSYTITDVSAEYEIEALNHLTPFDNEFVVYYDEDGGGYVSTGPSGQINSFTNQPFIRFEFTLPEGVDSVYKVIVRTNGKEEKDVTSSITGSNGSFTYVHHLAGSTSGFELYIYWTEEQYVYEHFNVQEKENIILEINSVNGNAVTCEYENFASYKNFLKCEVPSGTAWAVFNLNNSQKLETVNLDGNVFDFDNLPSYIVYDEENNTVSVDKSHCGNYCRLTLEFETDHKGLYSVNYLDGDVAASANVNGIVTTNLERGDWRQFPSYGSVIITFTPMGDRVLYGIKVTDHVSKTVSYIKASDLTNNNSYTISDFSKGYTVEAITVPTVFDNEFYVDFDTSLGVPVTVNGIAEELTPWKMYEYSDESEVIFNFAFNEKITSIYKAEIIVTDSEEKMDVTSQIVNGKLSYKPQDNRGFGLKIYFSEEEYLFRTMQPQENQFSIITRVNGEGDVTTQQDFNGSASYNNLRKFICDYDAENTVFVLDLMPNEGEKAVKVFVNGVELSPADYADGKIEIKIDGCHEISVDIEYTRYFEGVTAGDADGNGVRDAADYALVCLAARAGVCLDGEHMRACDLNHDGVVDAFDAIYLDLILHGVIEF